MPARGKSVQSLGIQGIDHVDFFVHELQGYSQLMSSLGFQELSHVPRCRRSGRQFQAGSCRIGYWQPTSTDSPEGQFLKQHPDGVGMVVFRVQNVETTTSTLARRGATLMGKIQSDDSGRWVDITTPIGDIVFRFLEPARNIKPTNNPLCYEAFDHFTCHFLTMAPVIWWFQEVMGFEIFWRFEFHTRRDCRGLAKKIGTGLRSCVMRCPVTGITFALNEPLMPDFQASQVRRFVQDNRGPGIQHIALRLSDICSAVRTVQPSCFLATPHCYYDDLRARLGGCKVREDVETLRELGILVDGSELGEYLLQIFMQSLAVLLGGPEYGPFFFELIQRRGANGFGEGNFRTLFEAVERSEARR